MMSICEDKPISDIVFDPKVLELIRKTMPRLIAEEIIGVQPMDPNLFKDVLDNAMSEEDLIKQGYEPVSSHRLMWVKR